MSHYRSTPASVISTSGLLYVFSACYCVCPSNTITPVTSNDYRICLKWLSVASLLSVRLHLSGCDWYLHAYSTFAWSSWISGPLDAGLRRVN